MIYQSPLHIIPKTIEFDGSTKQLKRLRKELLLRFDLSGTTTIDVEGKAFDKQSILQAIDALTQESEFHLKVYQHPNLLAFLEKQDLAFFRNSTDWAILAGIKFQNQLQPYFTAAYSKKLKAILAQQVAQPERELQILLNKDFHLPESYEAAAYTASMSYLRQWIQEIAAKFKDAHRYKDVPNFKHIQALTKKLTPYFTPFYLMAFLSLPNHFSKLKYGYANIAGDLVNFYIHQYYRLDRMGYNTIHLVKNFAAVVYQITGKYEEGFNELKQYADNCVKPGEEGKLLLQVFGAIMGILVCIVLFFGILSHNGQQANRAKTALMIGYWKTEMKLFNGKEKALRFLELKANGTGQTQIIINVNENNNCKLIAKFKWEITEKILKYQYERSVNFIQTKASRTIPIYQNAFSHNCDTLPPNYHEFYRNLSSALSLDELEAISKTHFTTATNSTSTDYFLVNLMKMKAGISSQSFHFEKVDSSYKKAIILAK